MIFDQVTNYYFWSVFTAWIISCIIKIIIDIVNNQKFCVLSGFRNGGMPSSHSAIMGSVTFALFLQQGFSPVFFLAIVVLSLFLRDAVTVRREVGILGEKINILLKKQKEKTIPIIYGHTVPQVFAGLFLGLLSACTFYLVFF